MAIGNDSLIEVSLNMLIGAQTQLNVFTYEVGGWTSFVEPIHIAEAWWNAAKASYRGLAVSAFGTPFQTVRVRELNAPTGDYAEFDIPSGEQAGSRANPTDADLMPYHVATAARLTVGTRLTRPGQKRFPFATQQDILASSVASAWKTLIGAVLTATCTPMTLGAPAAGVTLAPIVCRKDVTGTVVASQPITGFLVANYASSQNSRKLGRGI